MRPQTTARVAVQRRSLHPRSNGQHERKSLLVDLHLEGDRHAHGKLLEAGLGVRLAEKEQVISLLGQASLYVLRQRIRIVRSDGAVMNS